MSKLDRSHDPARRSWVAGADGHADFPIQNLPFAGSSGGVVVAIGNHALRLADAIDAGLGTGLGLDAGLFRDPTLNRYLRGTSAGDWTALRLAISDALADATWQPRLAPCLDPIDATILQPAVTTRDYTDFYASIHHATNVGSMFRPDNPLLPNYKWIPIGYHGRASTIVGDGTPIRRPAGQTRPAGDETPTVGPSRSLDYELELGIIIGGENAIGEVVPASQAMDRIFGVVLLNDWSARDLQAWEYQPLGPFLAKNFASTVSNWLVTRDALRPFEVPMPARPTGDPHPLPYLQVPEDVTWSLDLAVDLATAAMRDRGDAPFRVSSTPFAASMYWSPAQLVTHHASNGCALLAGDLLGTGTVSGPAPEARGCLLERTWRGSEPLALPDGTDRRFLEDGDEVSLSGRAMGGGAIPIGLGPCRGIVQSG